MQNDDRAEFETQLSQLCAGFNVPLGDRLEAYWRALSKMELHTFVRVVEHCLGEGGPEKIPTTGQCWGLSKAIRPPRAAPAEQVPQWTGDKWDIAANHHLMQHVKNHATRYAAENHTRILVQWKRAWSEDMRVIDNPSAQVAWDAWCDCMSRADQQIAQLSAL